MNKNTRELISILVNSIDIILSGDSREGHINWKSEDMLTTEDSKINIEYFVRHGNSGGMGGVLSNVIGINSNEENINNDNN